MALIGYSWVSNDAAAAEVQLEALEGVGCDPVFVDLATGAKAERPRLAEAVAFARRGDIFVVWKLDRIGSSIAQLIRTVRTLEEKGVAFRSLAETLDTNASGSGQGLGGPRQRRGDGRGAASHPSLPTSSRVRGCICKRG